VNVNAVQRPAEIVKYRAMGTAPDLLGAGLASGAAAALGLMLIGSGRRRRRELAVLKTLGFTRRQLASTIAWQSTVAVALGTAAGISVGIALGRWLWILFARDIDVVPAPTVPLPSIVLITVGAIVPCQPRRRHPRTHPLPHQNRTPPTSRVTRQSGSLAI
jgi:FtsX-like permease family